MLFLFFVSKDFDIFVLVIRGSLILCILSFLSLEHLFSDVGGLIYFSDVFDIVVIVAKIGVATEFL